MGASASFIGTCIQHDGSHGAFSTKSWLNTTAGWTLDMIGASAFTWEIQHVLGHHPYTNLMSVDNEISLQRNEQKATTELSQGKKKKKIIGIRIIFFDSFTDFFFIFIFIF